MDRVLSSQGWVERFSCENNVRIYRIWNQALPHLSASVFVLFAPDMPVTMIDAGSGEGSSFNDILRGLDTIHREFEPLDPQQIKRIILTHTHVDHFGGVAELKRLTGADVWVHAYERRTVESYNERATVSNCQFKDYCIECGIEPENVDFVLQGFGFLPGRIKSAHVAKSLYGGDSSDRLRFFHFPGHSPGSLAVALDHWVFSGDLILSHTITQIWPEALIPHTGMSHYMNSLDRLALLAQQIQTETGKMPVLFPGHEEIITNVAARIDLVKKSSQRRNRRIIEIIERNNAPMTVNEIAKKMYLTAHSNRTFFALCDVGARIEYLQQNNQIAVANYENLPAMNHPVYLFSPLF